MRTPGVPDGMRRLGDLRATCEISWQLRHEKDGTRDEAIAFKPKPDDPRWYGVPLGDASWPDDTLVVFE